MKAKAGGQLSVGPARGEQATRLPQRRVHGAQGSLGPAPRGAGRAW